MENLTPTPSDVLLSHLAVIENQARELVKKCEDQGKEIANVRQELEQFKKEFECEYRNPPKNGI
jgi:peptidoglycan hydrolase CwlO-like protein